MANELPPVPVAAQLPLTSLAGPKWDEGGPVVPPAAGLEMDEAQKADRANRFVNSVCDRQAMASPCYVCGHVCGVYFCQTCLRPTCSRCWFGVRLCCRLPDELEVPGDA